MRLVNRSVAECPKAFIEYEGANAELLSARRAVRDIGFWHFSDMARCPT